MCPDGPVEIPARVPIETRDPNPAVVSIDRDLPLWQNRLGDTRLKRVYEGIRRQLRVFTPYIVFDLRSLTSRQFRGTPT